MTFQLGDKVIYPNHGLGIVERIEEKTILGTTCGFFHLRIVSNDTTVLVPLTNVRRTIAERMTASTREAPQFTVSVRIRCSLPGCVLAPIAPGGLISAFGIREAILNAISPSLRNGIAVGIGLFITFIGLVDGKLVVGNPATLVSLGDFTKPAVWVRRSLTRTGRPKGAGREKSRYRLASASRSTLPDSTSWSSAVAVKSFEIDAARTPVVPGSIERPEARSADP